MPPRPRPKPRAKIATPLSPVTAAVPLTSSPTNTTHTSTLASIQDEDELFFKNRTRSAEAWRQLTKKADEADTRKHRLPDSEEETVTENDSSSPHRRKQKKPRSREVSGSKPLSLWTQRAGSVLEISSDEEDILNKLQTPHKTVEGQNQKRRQGKTQSTQQGVRSRSRSQSITPPPELPAFQIQHARETVRQWIGIPTKIYETDAYNGADDSIDSINLDPELAQIARQAKLTVQRTSSATHPVMPCSPSPFKPSSSTDSADTLVIMVRWQDHPLNSGTKDVKKWGFKMKRGDSFRVLFAEVADLAGVLEDNLVIRYDGKKVYPGASPRGIGMWGNAELEAGDKRTFDYLRENPHSDPLVTHTATPSIPTTFASNPFTPNKNPQTVTSFSNLNVTDLGEDEEDDTFKVIVRSSLTADKDITLTVRPTTKCGAIVKAFLKRAGLSDKYPDPAQPAPAANDKGKGKKTAVATTSVGTPGPVLMVDGDKLGAETLIGDMDLEDGDLVEVVGL